MTENQYREDCLRMLREQGIPVPDGVSEDDFWAAFYWSLRGMKGNNRSDFVREADDAPLAMSLSVYDEDGGFDEAATELRAMARESAAGMGCLYSPGA